MIIWINGAYGVGKTHTAYELHRRLANSFIFDPELVGFLLNKCLPDGQEYADFESMPLWRQHVKDILVHCHKKADVIIVPMTIIDKETFEFIIGGLSEEGIKVKHYTLMADKDTIEKRLARRGDKDAWNYKQIDRCLKSLTNTIFTHHIDTIKNNLNIVVELIATDVGVTLKKSRLNRILNKLKWLKIYIRDRMILSLISSLSTKN